MSARSTLSNTSEAQVITVDVSDYFVADVGSAGSLLAQVVRVGTLRIAKVVDGQRLVPFVDEFDDFTDVLEGENGHYWPKDLLSHQI